MPVEILSYQAAMGRCLGCDFAEPSEIEEGTGKYVAGCMAPVNGSVTGQMPLFKVLDHDTEMLEEDNQRVIVQLRFEPETHTVCTKYATGVPVQQYQCIKAIAAKKVEGKVVELVLFKAQLNNRRSLRLKY